MSNLWKCLGLIVLLAISGCDGAETSVEGDGQEGARSRAQTEQVSDEGSRETTDEQRGGDPTGTVEDDAAEITEEPDPLHDTGVLGPQHVGYTQMVITDPNDETREIPIDIWYPAAGFDASALTTYLIGSYGPIELTRASEVVQSDVAAAEGPWPLVVFSHGYGAVSTQSIDLCERLASHGFVVASPTHTGNTFIDGLNGTAVDGDTAAAHRPRDVKAVLDTLTARSENAEDLLFGTVDTEQMGVTGHSFGGFTSLTAVAGHAASEMPADARVKAIAPICPTSVRLSDEELAAITTPTLFLGGTLDVDTPIDPQVTRPYGLMTEATRYRVDVEGATHYHFANICDIGASLIDMGLEPETWPDLGAGFLLEIYQSTCNSEAYPIDEVSRLQSMYVVAFFRAYLRGESDYLAFLTEDYATSCEGDVSFYSEALVQTLATPECLLGTDS